jgi:hypothetical protein
MSSITAVPLQPVKRRVLVYLWAGIVIAVLGAVALAWMAPVDPAAAFLASNRKVPGVVQTASGLQYMILKPGKALGSPTDQDVALINFEGKLTNGTSFGQSQRTPVPVAASEGKAEGQGVPRGLSEALKLMTKGATYRFWIKPGLGYGDKAVGPIPAHSVLVFDVELLDFQSEAVIRQMQMQQQMMQQQQQGGAAGGGLPPGAGMPPGAGGPPPGP